MRAVLLASATATTRLGRRWRSPITHGSALVAFERSKLALAPLIRSRRKYWLPRLDIPPRRCLPPVEFCRGTRPSQAANSRPLRKPLGSTTVAAMAVAIDRADARNARQALADGVALVPGHELLLDRRNRRLQLLNLCRQHLEHLARQIRQPRVALIAHNGDQLADVAQALRRDHAELGQMPAQSVHQTRTLAHQPLPATVQQHSSLLVSRLDRHKAHRRAPYRLADRLRIGGIVLVALDVRLHVSRWHQSHLVPKRAQLSRPVVRRRARLQANQTWRQLTEERQNLRTPKLLAQNRRSLCIDPVHLKNMLRQVQSDRSNLTHRWLPFAAVSIRQQFGTQMPQGGHPPHHSITSSARASIIAATRTAVRHRTTFDIERTITFKSPGSTPPG